MDVTLDVDVMLNKVIINSEDLDIIDKSEWPQPRINDHVEIVSWDTQSHVQECVKLSKLPYLTVSAIAPVITGIGNDKYAWSYVINVKESTISFLQWHYKILN